MVNFYCPQKVHGKLMKVTAVLDGIKISGVGMLTRSCSTFLYKKVEQKNLGFRKMAKNYVAILQPANTPRRCV